MSWDKLSGQRGTALVVALFVVSLVALSAFTMMSRLKMDTHRTALWLHFNQANLYAQGSVDWAITALNHPIMNTFPLLAEKTERNGFTITTRIDDMQAYFNLNNLNSPTYQAYFRRLLQIIDPQLSAAQIEDILLATEDWISPVKNSSYDTYYEQLNPPYQAAHNTMASVSEFRLIKGVTASLFTRLSPYMTALPSVTPININTAPWPVIMSLTPSFDAESAKALAQYCHQFPSPSIESFLALDMVKNNPLSADQITVTSHYFLVTTIVSLENQHLMLYTLLDRTEKDSQFVVTRLWQTKGTL